jgi:2-dehydro-3-deoxy-D-arabinonate dehydratase
MRFQRLLTDDCPRWARDQRFLPAQTTPFFGSEPTDEAAVGKVLAPVEPEQEVWAAGVTYLRSRMEREAESATAADVYARVYDAERPELFFKAIGRRVVAPGEPIRIRRDSAWNVPEPELALVIDPSGAIVGYTAGNDVSSRSIEGENPLYLPQAKIYDGACALGPEIVWASAEEMKALEIRLKIERGGEVVFSGESSVAQMKRDLTDLADYLTRELTFPHGVILMTGTGIVPTPDFTLKPGDVVSIVVGELTLTNPVSD